MRRNGSILVGVLWCMVLLSVIVVGVLRTARMDLIVTKNYGDTVQAHYLALAGVERAKALIFQDLLNRQKAAKNHSGLLYDDPRDFREVPLGRGEFTVFRHTEDGGGGIVYGVSDEESRLNLNVAAPNQFTNLTGMTADILGAITSWRSTPSTSGADPNQTAPTGANSEYYLSLRPPYHARGGPFQSVRELLMVRGVTRELLFGNDDRQNGFLDADDNQEDRAFAALRPPQPPQPGWFDYLTVADLDSDVDASGQDRINAQNANQAELTTLPGITPEIANAIVAYRGQNPLQTLDDLLSVTPQSQNQNNQDGDGNGGRNRRRGRSNGPSIISQDLFDQIADHITVSGDQNISGLININTASLTVLKCLPGIDEPLARAIISYRKSVGYFASVAGLLKVDGMTRDIFRQVVPHVSARSETYRIICEGKVKSSGVRQRVEETVHIAAKEIETLGYREDL